MSVNKPLNEYGDLASQHHTDRQREESRVVPDATEEPKLWVVDGPGNLVKIEWSQGKEPIPFTCEGSWNHKGKAQEAIDGANARINAAKTKATKAAFDLAEQAKADLEAINAAKEVAAEQERIQADIDKQKAALADAVQREHEKPKAQKPARKTSTK